MRRGVPSSPEDRPSEDDAMDGEIATTEPVPATEPASPELPLILVSRATPAVTAQVRDFYESVAAIFRALVTRCAPISYKSSDFILD